MTITLQAVNELIASLESAGELSIKETKVLALAKAYQQLAAENVALKAGRKFFMYSDDSGFETFETQEEAIKAAHEMIDACREDAYDGWPEEADTIRWGVVIQQATETDFEKPAPENGWEGSSDYKLLPELLTTDRIVAGIKADGVEEWVSSRGGRWNGTTEEALKFAKQLREGADK
ncbi:hypothetical protein [Klebsiella variicola]|uniref:hypothetical protein n=1 Tax=Klebsiella variicola TaxID=244366 RepID=UPI0022571EF1|nr:hypothetical protein [Klebsiella variicola]